MRRIQFVVYFSMEPILHDYVNVCCNLLLHAEKETMLSIVQIDIRLVLYQYILLSVFVWRYLHLKHNCKNITVQYSFQLEIQ